MSYGIFLTSRMVKYAEDNSSNNNKYRIKLFTEATTRGQQTVANTVGYEFLSFIELFVKSVSCKGNQ